MAQNKLILVKHLGKAKLSHMTKSITKITRQSLKNKDINTFKKQFLKNCVFSIAIVLVSSLAL